MDIKSELIKYQAVNYAIKITVKIPEDTQMKLEYIRQW
jgi:hypothetical protein